jgi:hypothetical protein
MSLKDQPCWRLNISAREAGKLNLEAIGRFVEGSEEIRFDSANRQLVYGWVEATGNMTQSK